MSRSTTPGGPASVDRRAFLMRAGLVVGAACLTPAAARAARAAPASVELSLLKIRHATFLLDVAGTRVLVNPAFAPGLGVPFLFDAPAPALLASEVGDVDVLLVAGSGPTTFDPVALRRVRGRGASCFVCDEKAAKALRHLGYRRVRVLAPGDRYETRGGVVEASPAGDGLGFLVTGGGRSVWYTGAPPPLDIAAGAARFAQAHEVELVVACVGGTSSLGAPPSDIGPDDAALLARLARARFVVPAYDDGAPTLIARAFMKRELDQAPWPERQPPGAPRRVVVEPGVWYRVAS